MADAPCHHGLTDRQLALIQRALAAFADRIERVALFGSRAQGKPQPYSDVDLVLYGEIDDRTRDRLCGLFEESSLPFKVDVLVYKSITKPELKKHIDEVGRVLFTREELRACSKGAR